MVGQVDPSNMSTDDCYKTMLMLFSLAQEGAGIRHAMMTGPEVLRKHKTVFQDCYPMESQVLIDSSKQLILNLPSVIQTVFNTFLSMLDTRFHGMIKVIGNSGQKEKLTELLGEAVLPEEYGGTNGTIDEHRCFWKEE